MNKYKLSILTAMVMVTLNCKASTQDIIDYNKIIYPTDKFDLIKMVINNQKEVIILSGISSYDDDVLSLISKYTLISVDSLKKYPEASFYADNNNLIFVPGLNSSEKVKAIVNSQSNVKEDRYEGIKSRSLSTSSIAEKENAGNHGVFTLTTSMGEICKSTSLSATQKKYKISSYTFGAQLLEDIFTIEEPSDSLSYLDENERNNAGCDTAFASIRIYLNQPTGQTGSLTRNVEIGYTGLMKSINDGGYIYDNGSNGHDAYLRGFVDEIRFVTGFKVGNNWRLNTEMSSPLPDVYKNCTTNTDFGVSETSGWNLGGGASGEVSANENKMGISVTGGYNSERTISSNSGISCDSNLFKVANGEQYPDSVYHDDIYDADINKTFYSSLQLARIGDTEEPNYQSSIAYNTGIRDINSMIGNLISVQQSLDEKNRVQNPLRDFSPDTAMWPFTSHHAHKPFYNDPAKLVPSEVRNGFEHKAIMTYIQPYTSDSNRHESISPRIETWYNPGYRANYIGYWGYNFGLEFILGQNLTQKVTLQLPKVDIDWLDQRLMSVKTLGVESATGADRFITYGGNDFEVKYVAPNSTNFSQPFPITNEEHVFYMTNLITGDPNDKFQAFEINTYTTDNNGILVKKCLGVDHNNNPVIMDCGLGGYQSKTVWRYLTTSYINISEPAYDRSDFTICLRDKVDSEGNQCLTKIDNNLEIKDYADLTIGQTRFQWNLVDLAASKINYLEYYNQDN
ncbi:hypothetical protein ACMAZD_12365 [Vibrio sp. nBUS_14]|uniref:hypothetical protein n=1 Tax=Vibrio sp. nBUS_14 TaxID=3395321 RepID=UPI003EB925B0